MNSQPSTTGNSDPWLEIMPYDRDDRIVWAFLGGIRNQVEMKLFSQIADSLRNPSNAAVFGGGMTVGVFDGARSSIDEYIKSTMTMIVDISNWTIELYATVYDVNLLRRSVLVYLTAGNTDARVLALAAVADIYRERHPAGSDALLALGEMLTVLEQIAEWMKRPEAIVELLMALGRQLGELLGSELKTIISLQGQTYEQGKEIGNVIGQAMINIILFILGF